MAAEENVSVIDLSRIKDIHITPFVVGGAGNGENEDDATISALIYDNTNPHARRQVGIIRLTKPALEELTFTLIEMMGFHVLGIAQLRRDTK
jgi:hypothetical protein